MLGGAALAAHAAVSAFAFIKDYTQKSHAIKQ
jgi:hypothetical protein